MTIQQTKKLIDGILERALKAGAREADLILRKGKSLSLTAQKGEIDKFSASSTQIVGLRVVGNDRVGQSYTESLEPEAVERMIGRAVINMKGGAANPYQRITVAQSQLLVDEDSDLFQPDESPIEEKMQLAIYLESEVFKQDARTTACPYNGYSDGEVEFYYGNHLGTRGLHRERYFSCYTSALLSDAGKQSMFYRGTQARKLHDLDTRAVIETTVDNARALLDGKPVPTGFYDVVFDADTLQSFLAAFADVFSGKAAMEGKSQLRQKIGEEIASPLLTWGDRPCYSLGFGFSTFDDEGFSRKDMALIEKGVLKSLYHNTETAAFFKTTSTGHAARSPKSALDVGPTQWVIKEGATEEDDLKGNLYLKIISLQGLHSGTSTVTGDFSLAAKGFYCRDGELIHPVKGITISGNFFEMLKRIAGVGKASHLSSNQTFFSPEIRFSGVSVAGQ